MSCFTFYHISLIEGFFIGASLVYAVDIKREVWMTPAKGLIVLLPTEIHFEPWMDDNLGTFDL